MGNERIRDNLSKLSQLSTHLVTRMLSDSSVTPTCSEWEQLTLLFNLAGDADRQLRRERAKARGGRGVCRYCGCTEDNPCFLDIFGGFGEEEPCGWLDATQTVCSNPECVQKHDAKKKGKALCP